MQPLSADEVKGKAQQLGFELVGITNSKPPAHMEVFEHWLQEHRHGQMAYLSNPQSLEKRGNPRLILPECKSIVVLGMAYQPLPMIKTGNGGLIAGYACAPDYHIVLRERLQTLVEWIETRVGHPIANRSYTDSGPLLERELAQRAGLGWIGKNTCLIHPGKGSYFLLAEILVDLELEIDPPFDFDRCGSCKRCLEACPTGCILPDRTLDARRCIAYLTIELKEAIPTELRPAIGNWIFGCDICQQVCPWNQQKPHQSTRLLRYPRITRGKVRNDDEALKQRADLLSINLINELSLMPIDFNRKFKDTPVKRTKRRGYLRNVATALGNNADVQAIPVLRGVLRQEPDEMVRAHAAWALGKIGGKLARQVLLEAYLTESEDAVLDEIQQVLMI